MLCFNHLTVHKLYKSGTMTRMKRCCFNHLTVHKLYMIHRGMKARMKSFNHLTVHKLYNAEINNSDHKSLLIFIIIVHFFTLVNTISKNNSASSHIICNIFGANLLGNISRRSSYYICSHLMNCIYCTKEYIFIKTVPF